MQRSSHPGCTACGAVEAERVFDEDGEASVEGVFIGDGMDDHQLSIARAYLNSRVQTIYGGTTEIQKEIIGRSLGL